MDRVRYLFRLISQLAALAIRHRAWWLLPLVLALAILVLLGASGQAVLPFVYTLF